MTGWKATAAKLAAMVGLLIAGLGVSAALADPGNGNGPPSTVPGSPGDDCSHGNSGKDCRSDPNEHGKDCEDHGVARGNEDHCDSVDTPATTTSATSSTTTTTTTKTTTTSTSTTTTTNTPTTTTTQVTTNSSPPGTPGSPSGNGPPSGGSEAAGASTPPAGAPEVQQGPEEQVEGAQVTHVSRVQTSARPARLPFTGFPAWALALIGSALFATGLGLRRLA